MTRARATLTELEGAIAGVVRRNARCTAYRVRREFLTSPSAEWGASAGAVYPAIRRLVAVGVVRAQPRKDARGSETLSLTASGIRTHDRWLCDVARACGPGMDPFRTRAGLWPLLGAKERRDVLRALKKEIVRRSTALSRELPDMEVGDSIVAGLALSLQDMRISWLEAQEKR
jgi:DNA-binding PadR family transcriptional regulator